MTKLRIQNKTNSRIPFQFGSLNPRAENAFEVTESELEKARPALTDLANKGLISWTAQSDADVISGGTVSYYVDAVRGTVDGLGTQSSPFEYFATALAQVPTTLDQDYYIYLAGSSTYDGSGLSRCFNTTSGSLVIVGTNRNALLSGTLTGGVHNSLELQDSTKSWTADQWVGYSVKVGNLYQTIIQNTATSLFTGGYAYTTNTPTSGTYEIFEPAATLTVNVIGGGTSIQSSEIHFNYDGLLEDNVRKNVCFCNVRITSTAPFATLIEGSVEFSHGTISEALIYSSGTVTIGSSPRKVLDIIQGSTNGHGWGAWMKGSLYCLADLIMYAGVIENTVYGGDIQQSTNNMTILTGRLASVPNSGNSLVAVRRGQVAVLGRENSSSQRSRLLIAKRSGVGGTPAAGVTIAPGATCVLNKGCEISGATIAVNVVGGTAFFDDVFSGPAGSIVRTIDGTSRGLSVTGGGRAVSESNLTHVLASGGATGALSVGGATPVVTNSGAAGSLASTPSHTVHADGSAILRVPNVRASL